MCLILCNNFIICSIFRQNIALLYSNSARLMRLCAQVYGNGTKQAETENRGEFNQLERLYFNKVTQFYVHIVFVIPWALIHCRVQCSTFIS